MDERDFVARRQSGWSRLEAILTRAERTGIKSLTREELRELGPLYRRTASDLAYARAHSTSRSLKSHLNRLVARGFLQLYRTDTRSWNGLLRFFTFDFPDTFRRRFSYFLASTAMLIVGIAVGYLLVHRTSANISIWFPPGSMMRESLDIWVSGKTTHATSDAYNVVYASGLMTNNIKVSFLAFAGGIFGGVLTAGIIFYNGALLGAFVAYVTQAGKAASMWPALLPHGIVELSETCIAGAAGLAIGWALLAPGRLQRKDALRQAAIDSVRLILGGMLLLIFAGQVEGFLSHSTLPNGFKYVFAAVSGIALYAYLLLTGRDIPARTSSAPSVAGDDRARMESGA